MSLALTHVHNGLIDNELQARGRPAGPRNSCFVSDTLIVRKNHCTSGRLGRFSKGAALVGCPGAPKRHLLGPQGSFLSCLLSVYTLKALPVFGKVW